MGKDISMFLEVAIRLELTIAELYNTFSAKLTSDYEFWWQLYNEELNHAALLKGGRGFVQYDKFPPEILPGKLEELTEIVQTVEKYIVQFKFDPDRNFAFRVAYDLERSAGELHYQEYMQSVGESEILRIFRLLNRNDLDHAERIRIYRAENGII